MAKRLPQEVQTAVVQHHTALTAAEIGGARVEMAWPWGTSLMGALALLIFDVHAGGAKVQTLAGGQYRCYWRE
jgi:hypothetical protein